jgi:flagellar hook-basal body complex protein FliE
MKSTANNSSSAPSAAASSSWAIAPTSSGSNGSPATAAAWRAARAPNGTFSSALTGAIDSLDQTQGAASTAATQLADGQANDPTKAITSVENASLSMDLASQITSKLVTDLNTLYQTQV